MQNAFKRSMEFLDLDLVVITENKAQNAKSEDIMNSAIQNAIPEDIGNMQKILQRWAEGILGR